MSNWRGRTFFVNVRPSHGGRLTGAFYKLDTQGDVLRLQVEGDWSIAYVSGIDAELRKIADGAGRGRSAVFDLVGLKRLDTSGAFVLDRLAAQFERLGRTPSYEGLKPEFRILLEKINQLDCPAVAHEAPSAPGVDIVERVGAAVTDIANGALVVLEFLGAVIRSIGELVRYPGRLRVVPLVHHMERAGLDALPLICLLTFLIGAVIAQQGAQQLQQFGAEVYTVNLICIIFLREVGLLLTAIIVAGRSGSAFTAEIGSMKTREEIDAMRTLGLDPMQMLIVPRVLALIIVLPLLTFVADIMGLIGGGVVAQLQLHMSPAVYIERLRDSATFWTFGVGLVKAPFMALAIALIGCRAGLDVTGSAESVGTQTTRSVVRSIFLVIILDAFFAMFFSAVGL